MPPCWTNPAPQEGNYDFPQPAKHKQEVIYDVPPPTLSHYDFPPTVDAASPRQQPGNNGNEGIYDVPPPTLHSGAGPQRDVYDVPRVKRPPQLRDRGVYDVPAQDVTDAVNRLSISSTGSTRSSMSTSSSSTGSASEGRLPLDVDAAVQRLLRLQQAVDAAVWTLHSMAASPQWRTFTFMERHANDVRAALDGVRGALGDFLVFGRGAAANAAALSDSSLHGKLRRQLGRLEDSQLILLRVLQVLETSSWSPNVLAAAAAAGKTLNKSDDLDRFVMVSRSVPDDAKQLASTVGANAELLFRRTDAALSPAPSDNDSCGERTKPLPQDKDHMTSERCVKSWMEDYDYVHLQVRGQLKLRPFVSL